MRGAVVPQKAVLRGIFSRRLAEDGFLQVVKVTLHGVQHVFPGSTASLPGNWGMAQECPNTCLKNPHLANFDTPSISIKLKKVLEIDLPIQKGNVEVQSVPSAASFQQLCKEIAGDLHLES